jgi:hypothetical protein
MIYAHEVLPGIYCKDITLLLPLSHNYQLMATAFAPPPPLNSFETTLDKFCVTQDFNFNWKSSGTGTSNRNSQQN